MPDSDSSDDGLRSVARAIMPLNTTIPAGIDRYMLSNERDAITVRQHPAVLIGPAVLAFAGFFAAAIFTHLVTRDKQDFALAAWIAASLLFLRLVIRIFAWVNSFFVISTVRILLVSGLFVRRINSILFSSVTDMAVRRSVGGRLLGYGKLVVEYGGLDQRVQEIEYIPYAEEFYQMISEAIFSRLEKDPDTQRVSCPMCNGEGKIFRRASKPTAVNGPAGDDLPAGDVTWTREDLMARGYVEAVCQTCDGEGTVRQERS